MINITLSKIILSIIFIGATLVAYEAIPKNTIENLDSNKKLSDSGLSEQWRHGNVILLMRCDRSSTPCLGPDNGITVSGSEKAKKTGAYLKAHFELANADAFTSPTVRTVQTSSLMLEKTRLLPDREAICGYDIIDKLRKYKTTNRNLILVTHDTCINDLISASRHQKSENPEYGSLLFSQISSNNKIQIIGKINPD